MLGTVGRAAAGRAMISSTRLATTSNLTARFSALSIKPVAVRSFSVLQSPLFAAAKSSSASSQTKKTTKTTKKTTAKKTKMGAPAEKKKKKAPKKKELTPEQEERAKIKSLKVDALYKQEPSGPRNPWGVYVTENLGSTGAGTLSERVGQLKESFNGLSVSELEKYKAKADSNKEEIQTKLKEWIESQPVEVIYLANLARISLNHRTNKRIRKLEDDRIPKRPQSAYTLYFTERYSSSSAPHSERFKAVAEEWNNLSESEKQTYVDRAAGAFDRYREEKAVVLEKAAELRKERKASAKST